METGVILGFGLLALFYVLVILDVLDRTASALLVAGLVFILNIPLGFSDFEELVNSVNLDTILLLMSMMILVHSLARTGAFDYLASRILLRLRESPFTLMAVLTGLTAFVSAFIDNVTTVLLIAPIIIEMSRRAGFDPLPLLMSVVFASNIGGTATLVGDPPNIIIGSVAKLSFMSFITNLAPIIVVDFLVFLLVVRLMFSGWMEEYRSRASSAEIAEPRSGDVEWGLLRRVLAVLIVVVVLFFLQDRFHYPPAVPAMIGVALLLVFTGRRVDLAETLVEGVDWTTLVFFIAMFIVIKGVEDLGVIHFIANGIAAMSKDPLVTALLIVWVSAVASAFIDNIPFTMAMVSIIPLVSATLRVASEPLYWSLSLGACLGGNGTIIGASANIVVAGIADKQGYRMTFNRFMKYGFPVMLVTVAVSSVYVALRYYIIGF